MDDRAQMIFAAEAHDPGELAKRSAEIWAELMLDDAAHATLRRDGLDPAALRLSGPHPFAFEAAPDEGVRVIAQGRDRATAEARLDLFRVHFLRRLAG